MILFMELQNLNYIAIAIATMASYVLGFVWYHWAVFGKTWANALGLTKKEADNTEGLGGAFAISLVSGATKTTLISLLISATGISGLLDGLLIAAIIALVTTVASLGYYNGFARIPAKLTLINSAHSLVELCLIGAIIGAFA